MKHFYLFFIFLFCFTFFEGKGQNGIIGDGFANGWAVPNDIICFDGSLGGSRIGTFAPNGGNGDKFFRLVTCWDGNNDQWGINGGDVDVTIGVEMTNVNQSQTGSAYRIEDANENYNYVFKTRSGGNPPPNPAFVVFEVQGDVRTITGVTQEPAANDVFFDEEVTITATLDGNLNHGQAVYIRYSNDGFETSTIMAMQGSGNTYTVEIPAQDPNDEVAYYVFTSGTTLANDTLTITPADANFFTINFDNNSGSNYSYTTRGEHITVAGATDWNVAASWRSGEVPPNDADVIIAHNLNLTDNRQAQTIEIQSGATLTLDDNEELRILDSGSLTNNGSIVANYGTLIFSGSGSILGSEDTDLHNLEINGEVNVGSSTTVANECVIKPNSFFSTNAPLFLENSTLVYDTGDTYTRGIEWNNDDTNTPGTPFKVEIRSSNFQMNGVGFSSGVATIPGDLLITGGEFSMDGFTYSNVEVDNIIIDGGDLIMGETEYDDSGAGRGIIANGDLENLEGSITLGSVFQADVTVRGTNVIYETEDSTFNSNGRAIIFEGDTDIIVTSTGEINIDFVVIDMSDGKVIVDNNLNIQGFNPIDDDDGFLLIMRDQATLDLAGFNLVLGHDGNEESFAVTMEEDTRVISTPTTVITILNQGDTQLRLDESEAGVTNAVRNLIVRNNATTTISNYLHIFESLDVDGATVDGNDKLIFRSSENQTAVISEVKNEGQVIGNIRTERFFNMEEGIGNRAFRFISPSVTSVATINAQWQEGVNNTGFNYPNDNIDPNPGFGTHITGSTEGQNGFDATQTGNPSLFTWEDTSNGWDWVNVPNTDNTTLQAGTPLAIMIRGDRSTILNTNYATGNSTILRSVGTPLYGEQTLNTTVDEGDFVFVGNPYQAQVDLTQVETSGFTDVFYIWDASMGTFGGYALVEINSSGDAYASTTVPDAGTDVNQYLQVNQAFFMEANQTAQSITFRETHKHYGVQNITSLSTQTFKRINVNLLRDGNLVVDGLRIDLDENYADEVNSEDATKLWNLQEYFAIDRNPNWLMIEKRSIPENDSIQFYLDNYFSTDYSLSLNVQNIDTHKVFLYDAYLDESTELENNQVNTYAFEVESNIQATQSQHRFSLHFEEISLANQDFEESSFVIYPNPTYGEVNIQLTNSTIANNLHITITDLLGKKIYEKEVKIEANKGRLHLPPTIKTGVYLVHLRSESQQSVQKIIKK